MAQPACLFTNNVGVIFLGANRPGREAERLPSGSDEVRNEWRYTYSIPIYLHGVNRNSCIPYFYCVAYLCCVMFLVVMIFFTLES